MLPATLFDVKLELCTTISLTQHSLVEYVYHRASICASIMQQDFGSWKMRKNLDTSILIESAASISLLDENAMVSIPSHFSAAFPLTHLSAQLIADEANRAPPYAVLLGTE